MWIVCARSWRPKRSNEHVLAPAARRDVLTRPQPVLLLLPPQQVLNQLMAVDGVAAIAVVAAEDVVPASITTDPPHPHAAAHQPASSLSLHRCHRSCRLMRLHQRRPLRPPPPRPPPPRPPPPRPHCCCCLCCLRQGCPSNAGACRASLSSLCSTNNAPRALGASKPTALSQFALYSVRRARETSERKRRRRRPGALDSRQRTEQICQF